MVKESIIVRLVEGNRGTKRYEFEVLLGKFCPVAKIVMQGDTNIVECDIGDYIPQFSAITPYENLFITEESMRTIIEMTASIIVEIMNRVNNTLGIKQEEIYQVNDRREDILVNL